MRTFLVFHQNGEIAERLCNCRDFDMNKIIHFDNCKTYYNYIVLYNENKDKDYNLTKFNFTNDKFRGDIGLVKLDKQGKMIDLKIDTYFSKLMKDKINSNDLYYSSDEESYSYNIT